VSLLKGILKSTFLAHSQIFSYRFPAPQLSVGVKQGWCQIFHIDKLFMCLIEFDIIDDYDTIEREI